MLSTQVEHDHFVQLWQRIFNDQSRSRQNSKFAGLREAPCHPRRMRSLPTGQGWRYHLDGLSRAANSQLPSESCGARTLARVELPVRAGTVECSFRGHAGVSPCTLVFLLDGGSPPNRTSAQIKLRTSGEHSTTTSTPVAPPVCSGTEDCNARALACLRGTVAASPQRMITSMEMPMPCERCEELELRHLNRTEEYINLVELQSRLFRNREAKAGARWMRKLRKQRQPGLKPGES